VHIIEQSFGPLPRADSVPGGESKVISNKTCLHLGSGITCQRKKSSFLLSCYMRDKAFYIKQGKIKMRRSIYLYLGALSLFFIALTPALARDYVTFDELLEIVDLMHTDQRHTDQRHTDQRHTDQLHTDQRHTDQLHTDQRHTDQRHTDQLHTDQRHTDQGVLAMRSSCDLSMEVQNVRCNCSGTDCSSSGTGNHTVLTCADPGGTTTCSVSVTNNGENCKCTTVDKASNFAFR